MMEVRFRNGRALGKVEEDFGAQLAPGDTFRFAGLDLEVEGLRDNAILVRAARKSGMIPSYMGARMPLTTHLADRVRAMLTDRAGWGRLPDDVREWLEMQDWRSRLPGPDELLVESFPRRPGLYRLLHVRRLEREPVAGHADHAADGRSRSRPDGLRRQRLCPCRMGPARRPRSGNHAVARDPRR
jgi:Lhr-like helicase